MIEAGPRFFIDFTVVTLGALTACMILEMLLPARDGALSVARWLNNTGLALITYACNHLAGTLAAVAILYMSEAKPFPGLANVPLWLDVSATVLALELARYGTHVAMHKLPLLWRFHAVHHTDSAVDVSTSFRHHPIEALIAAVPLTAVVWLLGGAPEVLILYRAWDLIMTVMTHSNVEVPIRLERWLQLPGGNPGVSSHAPPRRKALHRLKLQRLCAMVRLPFFDLSVDAGRAAKDLRKSAWTRIHPMSSVWMACSAHRSWSA